MIVKCRLIFLIGFMGSGKTTAGSKLAALLNWSFTDLDRSIEEHTGKSISEIFSQNGEEYFRKIETYVLRNLGSAANTIISTGGGTPCYEDNMNYMLDHGLTIYLKMTPPQLRSRLAESKGERPLIKDLDNNKLLSFIEGKLTEREKWYNRSDIITEGFDLDMNLLYSKIKPMITI